MMEKWMIECDLGVNLRNEDNFWLQAFFGTRIKRILKKNTDLVSENIRGPNQMYEPQGEPWTQFSQQAAGN